ncbi:hypothetical protein [Aliiroseovarius subalbicans]|uniref:hypothetical protein n=1 Tax=Aliiroseovarius subalbicans TaxID=2925840 RepID=UPI001F57436C|nr:hypothetical protein [Aliiroseovarius subalbicans]MCI2399755.1 hypothetical protein [Aliiroseovarius subalbicans]
MRLFIPVLVTTLTALAGCDSPGVAFMGSEKIEVEVEGSTFSVHRRENRVEVYRTSRELLPKLGVIMGRSKIAIEQATQCKVRDGTMTGDHAIQRASLNCTGKPDTASPGFSCDVVDSYNPETGLSEVVGINCVPT